jgi:hypothetical protein
MVNTIAKRLNARKVFSLTILNICHTMIDSVDFYINSLSIYDYCATSLYGLARYVRNLNGEFLYSKRLILPNTMTLSREIFNTSSHSLGYFGSTESVDSREVIWRITYLLWHAFRLRLTVRNEH